MKQKIIQELTGKSVLILGFGREGRSTYKFIRNNNIDCVIGIADIKEIKLSGKSIYKGNENKITLVFSA